MSMKTIALLTIAFLPGTFVAVSTPIALACLREIIYTLQVYVA